MSRLQCALIALPLFLGIVLLPAARAVDQITLYVPAFQGPGSLGRNVATVLNLQIWQTFRRMPWPDNPKNLDFGLGLVLWDTVPLGAPNHSAAEQRAMVPDVSAQMTLWGKVYPYGDGAVAKCYLSIPDYRDFRDRRLERWSIRYQGETIAVDIPRRRHEMAPILLSHDVIRQYSVPSALKLYSQRAGGSPIGAVGDSYLAIQLEPRVALVRTNGREGWVRLPELAKARTEVVDFVGGVIRIFRGDWEGAVRLMESVINNPATPSPLKHDACLYLSMAMERLGKPARFKVEQALALNPFSRVAVQYAIMCDFEQLLRQGHVPESAAATDTTRRIKATLDANAHLFPEDDAWMLQVRRVVGR